MRRVLLDTNLLILLLVGSARSDLVGEHKRLRAFTAQHWNDFSRWLEGTKSFVTSPNILTETSNLLDIGKGALPAVVSNYISFVEKADELEVTSKSVVGTGYFLRFGLTDATILHLIRADVEVGTVDYKLYGVLNFLGVRVTNIRNFTNLGDT